MRRLLYASVAAYGKSVWIEQSYKELKAFPIAIVRAAAGNSILI